MKKQNEIKNSKKCKVYIHFVHVTAGCQVFDN